MSGGRSTSALHPIGVLGGMGPEATIYFMQQVVRAVDARDDADHVPLIVEQNTQVPSRISAIIEGVGEDPAPVLIDMARRLENAGAVALVMPCNTAHHFAEQIAGAVHIPFLNMIELASAEGLRRTGKGGTIGILGSPALRKAAVFEAAFENAGIQPLYCADEDAALELIRTIKRSGPTQETAGILGKLAQNLVKSGADAICICCTEFSMHHQDLEMGMAVFDSLDLLVDATIAASRGGEQQSHGGTFGQAKRKAS